MPSKCIICFEAMQDDVEKQSKGRCLPCGHHAFHDACLRQWWGLHWVAYGAWPHCPMCRFKVADHGMALMQMQAEGAGAAALPSQSAAVAHTAACNFCCCAALLLASLCAACLLLSGA